jgi:membrane fusion protein, multidrug efflux system
MLVDAVQADVGDFASRITLTGEVQADVTSDLAFQTGGQVLERFVEVGDRIEANQVLARLSSSEQIADRDAGQAALEAARFALEQAQTDLSRQQDLLQNGLTTRSAFDSATEAAATASSRLDAAQASYESAVEALDQTELRAFSSGIITARQIETGQVVQAGQPAFTLAIDGPRNAVFEVDEGVLTDVFAAQSFEVRSASVPQVTTTATLKEVSPTIDSTSGSIEITLALASTPDGMSLGSVVTTSGEFAAVRAVAVPASALTSENNQPAVWVVDPDSYVVTRRPVDLAAFNNASLVITDGLAAGDLVVTSGTNLLFPGQTVRTRQSP